MCQEAALAGHEDVWPGPGTMEFPGFSRRGLASTLSSTTNGAGCSTSKGQTKSDGRSSQCWAVVPSSVGSCKKGRMKLFDGHFSRKKWWRLIDGRVEVWHWQQRHATPKGRIKPDVEVLFWDMWEVMSLCRWCPQDLNSWPATQD